MRDQPVPTMPSPIYRYLLVATMTGAVAAFGAGCVAESASDTEGDGDSGENIDTSESALSGCIYSLWDYVVTSEFAYLRACPSTSCEALAGIGPGSKFFLDHRCPTNGFYYGHKSSGTHGWVNGSHLVYTY